MSITVKEAIRLIRDEAYTVFIFNNCYGGGPPELRPDLASLIPEDTPETLKHINMLEVIDKVGFREASSDIYSAFGVSIVPLSMKDYMRVREYDGLESPFFQSDMWRMDKFRELLKRESVMTKANFDDICKEADDMKFYVVKFEKTLKRPRY